MVAPIGRRGFVVGAASLSAALWPLRPGHAAATMDFDEARHLLSRLENPGSGEIAPEFHVGIPESRREQAQAAATALGAGLHAQLPLTAGLRPVVEDPAELLLNRAWRPQLAITGLDGMPGVADAAAVMQPSTHLKLSLRLPPTLDADAAAVRLKALLEDDPPYRSDVVFRIDMVSKGWRAPATAPWLAESLERASQLAFGASGALIGGGGGIPFLAMLGERYPDAQFVVTGVLGPQSNAHGPNEFLHLPTAQRITAVVASLLHDAQAATAAVAQESASTAAAPAVA